MIKKYFPALAHDNYRRYWIGQLISLIGTWMQRMGQAWLVYEITNSPMKLGIVGSLQFLPILLFSLIAGVWIDRLPKKRILYYTQFFSMVLAFALAFLVLVERIEYYQVLIMAFLLGCANAIDMPTRQSYMIELVGKEDLSSAVALNSTIFNLARVIGPSIAGVVMASFHLGWCFFVNGLSFLAVMYSLARIDAKSVIKEGSTTSMWKEMREGLSYIKNHPILLQTVLTLFYTGILAFNFSVLIPIIARDILHLREQGYGALMSSLGLGSLLGAVILSVKLKQKIHQAPTIITITNFVMGVMLICIGLSTNFPLTLFLLFVCGFFNLCFSITANSLLQLTTEDRYRGRVMSVHAMVFAGTTPIGNFFTGMISEHFGAGNAFIVSGILIMILCLSIKYKYTKSNSVTRGR
ncbi:MAG: MFS transporter [Oligoflexia bacterium]|nr:MFS transporter [Oligoflexia bacterium]MBF0364290.1 MFS transporter [Oligoflexia bacterium]